VVERHVLHILERPLIETLERPGRGVGEDAGEDLVGFAAYDGVGVLDGLARKERWVHPPQHDGHAPRPVGVGDGVGAGRGGRPHGERGQVGLAGTVVVPEPAPWPLPVGRVQWRSLEVEVEHFGVPPRPSRVGSQHQQGHGRKPVSEDIVYPRARPLGDQQMQQRTLAHACLLNHARRHDATDSEATLRETPEPSAGFQLLVAFLLC
jgi:hypothetical protein